MEAREMKMVQERAVSAGYGTRLSPAPSFLFDLSPTGAQWEGREECDGGAILEGLSSYSEETEFQTGKAELSLTGKGEKTMTHKA